MNYRKYVGDLERKCDIFLEQVATIGNECAWTDRAVEAALASADILRKKYYGDSAGELGVAGSVLADRAEGNNYKARVEVLKGACEVFRGRVMTCGNECAHTDAALEMALDAAKALKVAYWGLEPVAREGASIDEKIGAAVALKGAAGKDAVSPKATEKGGHDHVL